MNDWISCDVCFLRDFSPLCQLFYFCVSHLQFEFFVHSLFCQSLICDLKFRIVRALMLLNFKKVLLKLQIIFNRNGTLWQHWNSLKIYGNRQSCGNTTQWHFNYVKTTKCTRTNKNTYLITSNYEVKDKNRKIESRRKKTRRRENNRTAKESAQEKRTRTNEPNNAK